MSPYLHTENIGFRVAHLVWRNLVVLRTRCVLSLRLEWCNTSYGQQKVTRSPPPHGASPRTLPDGESPDSPRTRSTPRAPRGPWGCYDDSSASYTTNSLVAATRAPPRAPRGT